MSMLRSLSLALSIVASLVGCSTPGAFFVRWTDRPSSPIRAPMPATPQSTLPSAEPVGGRGTRGAGDLPQQRIDRQPAEQRLPGVRVRDRQLQAGMRRPLAGSFWTLFADGPMDFTRIASFMLEARAARSTTCATTNSTRHRRASTAGEGDGPLHWWRPIPAAEIGATHQVQEPMQPAAAATGNACSARSGKALGGPWTRSASEPGTRSNRLLPASPADWLPCASRYDRALPEGERA